MNIYLPLELSDGIYKADTTFFDNSAWSDSGFVEFFEDNIERNFESSVGCVSILGTDYPNCDILTPKSSSIDRAYALVDDDYIPRSVTRDLDELKPESANMDSVAEWLVETRNSELFFRDLSVDLSTKYILPTLSIDGGEGRQIFDFRDITKDSRVLVIGAPGAGKTSFARHLAHYYMRKFRTKSRSKTVTTMYFQLRRFSEQADLFSKVLDQKESSIGRDHVSYQESRGRTLYIFDGLDELNENDRAKFSQWLDELHSVRKSTSTIVTSRYMESLNQGLWKSYTRAKLEPFNQAQVSEFCSLMVHDKKRSAEFLGMIDDNPYLRSFLTNPFSLSLAIGVFLTRGVLPYNIGALCKEVVAHLVEKWDSKRGINRDLELNSESTISILGRLAYKLQTSQTVQFKSDILNGILPIYLEGFGASQVLREISFSSSLVKETSADTWSFSHRYFQDFFCANFLMEKAEGLSDELGEHGNDLLWTNIWRQVGQLCSDPEYFARVESRIQGNPIHSIDRIVASLLGHNGLSKDEVMQLVHGLIAEIRENKNFLPNVEMSHDGTTAVLKGASSDTNTLLASLLINIYYLKYSGIAEYLSGALREIDESGFADFTSKILNSNSKPRPRLGIDSVEVSLD